ncbi:hypothetical protein FPG87_12810 [Flavobacterium psychrophilum]|uniref:Retroviral-like aspartic protease family protein n=1 Tax=Flavobacterium psychrophilum TaxID=96345 RepID=A0A7U2RAD6_FLAPS|nr:retropepsin-like aspartic protease [Flavobacterium psychrophilum]ELI6456083.1 retroviral-like aspartic protease family protein [Flavobacterium psychrophilum]OJH14053.1 hypothetical protein FPG87_12810 [Flavobacterium psychrophilum]QRE04836.1 retroviral-like aspartic protease family protein [Flavobacterium psychrophilum]SNA80019.1 conserved hypothetical protein [Flavobacterium psychrophilum]
MKKKTFLFVTIFYSLLFYSQTKIPLEYSNGVNYVNCKINNIPLKFILDTGAADVSISKTEALFLIKNDFISYDDFIGKSKYINANGEIIEGSKINLKEIEFGGIIVKNVVAVVLNNDKSPLLLGQSFLSKIGPYTINNNELIIQNGKEKKPEEKEIFESFEWLKKSFESHLIKNDSLQINITLSEIKLSKQDGYVLIGFRDVKTNNKTDTEKFIIFLDEIISVSFNKNEKYSMATNLTMEAKESGKGIMYYSNDSKDMYITNIYDFELFTNEEDKKRILNAIKNILENNKNFIHQTQKH